MIHDFKKFPELTNSQMNMYYFDSPHQQITEDFWATVIDVHDGDTIKVKTSFRDFNFPIRFANILAPELSEEKGFQSQSWLASQILNQDVEVLIDKKNRVDKWGRLLGRIQHMGFDIGQLSIQEGMSVGLDEQQARSEMGETIELLILKTEWA